VLGGTIQPPFVAGTPVDALLAGQFTTGGRLVAQKVSTKITHPDQFQIGVAYTGVRNLNLEADYAWIGWSKFDELPVTFADPALSRTLIEDYNNTSVIRLGAEYTLPENHWRLRGGFVGAQSAAPEETVTPLLPEQERNYYTVGVGIPFMMTWALDLSYAYVHTPGARGRIIERASQSQTAAQLNSGVYSVNVNIFSLTLKASF
jgi:long-chain fatty acid transport protein